MENNEYDLLYFREDEQIPRLKGTRIRAETLYTTFNTNRDYYQTSFDLAKDTHLPLEAVEQALQWCKQHHDLVTLVLAEERRKGGLSN